MNWLRRTIAPVALAAVLALPGTSAPALAAPRPVAPKAAPPSSTATQIEARLQQMLTPALKAVGNMNVRALIRNIVGRQFDDDTNALWSTIIQEAEASQLVQPDAPDWVALKQSLLPFKNINGWSYDPQVYIPSYDEIGPAETVAMVVKPADGTLTAVPGYWLGLDGQIHPTDSMITEDYADTHDVWVLSVNERIVTGGTGPTRPPRGGAVAGPSTRGLNAVCNPTGLRNQRGLEFMLRWRVPNKSTFGELFEGKRKMRFVVITGTGSIIMDYTFPNKVKKKHIDEWQYFNPDMMITTWDTAVIGPILAYQWWELDGGKTTTSTISVPIPGGGSVSTSVTSQDDDDNGGLKTVQFSESTNLIYSTGSVEFQMCTQGGDGGTGIANLACGAIASASSTFRDYSPARATDCNRDTRLGPQSSWANDRGTYPPNNPEWLQIDLGVNRTFQRAVVYTSDQGFAIRDFDLQIWNGVVFVNVAVINGNAPTATMVTILLPAPVTSRLVRVSGRSGPTTQPGFVRVNELEIYVI